VVAGYIAVRKSLHTAISNPPSHFPVHDVDAVTAGQVAAVADAAAAWPDDEDDPELPDDAEVVSMVLLAVHPASATAITIKNTAIMPYDEIFMVLLSIPEKFFVGDIQGRHKFRYFLVWIKPIY
jgi:hypothetical protein